jgi:hypothetical protein
MDFYSRVEAVAAIFCLTLTLNLFFGYLRAKTRKFSLKWFLYIHLPIPFIFLSRVLSHLDIRYVPIFAVAAVLGQLWGSKLQF